MKVRFLSEADKIFYKVDRYNKLVTQDYKCYYCGCTLTRKTVTTDHVIPLKNTNRYHSSKNTVAACNTCNSKKSDKQFKEDWYDKFVKESAARFEERLKLAEWKLSTEPKGSFKKWKRYHKK